MAFFFRILPGKENVEHRPDHWDFGGGESQSCNSILIFLTIIFVYLLDKFIIA